MLSGVLINFFCEDLIAHAVSCGQDGGLTGLAVGIHIVSCSGNGSLLILLIEVGNGDLQNDLVAVFFIQLVDIIGLGSAAAAQILLIEIGVQGIVPSF